MLPPRLLLALLSLTLIARVCHAVPLAFSATLSGANEVPAVSTAGTGFVTVTYDPVTHFLAINASFSNLTGTTTASHIHAPAAPGTNAGVATTTPSFAGFPLGVTSGIYTNTLDLTMASSYNPAFLNNATNLGSVSQAEMTLFSALNNGAAYFNIHTSFAGGGEVRGNLAAVVPESGSAALLMIPTMLGLIGIARGRCRIGVRIVQATKA